MITLQLYVKSSEDKSGSGCCSSKQPACCDKLSDIMAAYGINAESESNNSKPGWISGIIDTPAGQVPAVKSVWSGADKWGRIRSRISSFRNNYSLKPGLYAIGSPNVESEVFVSANYKLSFDILRRELDGINGWILVLDTKGINVWCAAGKGTFGTDELVKQINLANLAGVVSHRRIIVPQLGAVGVKASEVKKKTGFHVSFGPVKANDIKRYFGLNRKASPEMREVKFLFFDRLELTPMELIPALKKFPAIALIILILFGIEPSGIIFRSAWLGGWPFLLTVLAGIFTGAFFTPAFLPFIPFRSFALKGALTGFIAGIFLVYFTSMFNSGSGLLKASAIMLITVLSSYLALQFTGSSTFTGMTGVKKELKFALPVYIAGAGAALIFIILHKLNVLGII